MTAISKTIDGIDLACRPKLQFRGERDCVKSFVCSEKSGSQSGQEMSVAQREK
jgi:hypothetical protein